MESGQIWKIFKKKKKQQQQHCNDVFFFLGQSKQVTMKYLENVLKMF